MPAPESDQLRTLSLKGFGAPANPATAVTRHLSIRQRLGRGSKALGLALVAVVVMLPIPIIHIVGPPFALLLGLGVGIRRLGQGEIFISAEGTCPFCQTTQRLGLAGSRFRVPCNLICNSCRRPLQLEAGPAASPDGNNHG